MRDLEDAEFGAPERGLAAISDSLGTIGLRGSTRPSARPRQVQTG
jgi:hypothetical protein